VSVQLLEAELLVDLFIAGTPIPQGSKRVGRHGRHPVILDTNDKTLKPWRQLIQAHLADTGINPTGQGVLVECIFWLACPKSLPKRSTPIHTKRPDIDKLARAALDAATGLAFLDDSQVAKLIVEKRYARNMDLQPISPGLQLRVSVLPG
jgi:crossover junction endodeoxyribonuclease RusA